MCCVPRRCALSDLDVARDVGRVPRQSARTYRLQRAIVENAALNPKLWLPMTQLPRLPFGFARKHGVAVLGVAAAKARVACRPDVKPDALLELRRFLGVPLALEKVSSERFEALLQELYEGGGEDSRSMAENIDQRLDLKQLADELPCLLYTSPSPRD